MKNLQGEKIGDYDYNYTYKKTRITHKIEEFYDSKRDIRFVLLRKETRKGDKFIKLPSSLWVTCSGYPPLSTDAALHNAFGRDMTYFYAGMPTVQSDEHIKIFDDYLRGELSPLGIDYESCSRLLKERPMSKEIPTTGFVYNKKDVLDEELAPHLLEKVCKAYEEVLKSEPCECPVNMWVDRILGDQTSREYFIFKKGGFDVPFSGQRAFFTIIMDRREVPDSEDDGYAEKIEKSIKGE